MKASQATSQAGVRGAQSIDRAMQLLQLMAAHHAQGIGLAQLVEATGLDRTTVYRIASSLVRSGMAARTPAWEVAWEAFI